MKRFLTFAVLCGMIPSVAFSKPSSLDRSVLNDPDRPAEEKAQDADRKAIDVYTFLGIEPGMTIADLWPGGGYNTHLLSRLMGEDGKVFCMMGFYRGGRYKTLDKIEARIAKSNLSNVGIFNAPADLPQSSIDVMVSIRNYHDAKAPRDTLIAELKAALKKGGIIGIVDVATDHPGWDEETHRLNEQVVIDEFTANGFTLEGSSDMLRNPDDDHSIMGFEEGRHTMDRYLLKFKKK
ncbi:MAG: hypothetical protein VX822_06110 [Candidatus Neomarinimicrobiota bacterium]|nr:hypothetical protein [Candidatus Neomarinimicrobiota bacterium]